MEPDYDERSRSVIRLVYDNPKKIFGWHSVSCVCDECLNADAALAIWNVHPSRYDTVVLYNASANS